MLQHRVHCEAAASALNEPALASAGKQLAQVFSQHLLPLLFSHSAFKCVMFISSPTLLSCDSKLHLDSDQTCNTCSVVCIFLLPSRPVCMLPSAFVVETHIYIAQGKYALHCVWLS